MRYIQTIVALALVLVTATAPVAGVTVGPGDAVNGLSSAPVTAQQAGTVPSDQVYNATSDVSVWKRSSLTLRADFSNAPTQVAAPDLRMEGTGVGESSAARPRLAVENAGETVGFQFDDARAGLNLSDAFVQVIAVRITATDGTAVPQDVPGTVALLNGSSSSAVTYYSVGQKNLSAQGTADFAFTPPGPGQYRFLAVTPQSGTTGLSVSNGDLSVDAPVTLVGVDGFPVQRASGSVSVGSTTYAASTVAVNVDASSGLDGDVDHFLLVYEEDTFVGSTQTISTDPADIDDGYTLVSGATVSRSTQAVVGESSVPSGFQLSGVDLTDSEESRSLSIAGMADYIVSDTTSTAPAGATEAEVLNASSAAVTNRPADGTVPVRTQLGWDSGTYTYVYVAQNSDNQSALVTQTGTLDVQANPFPNGIPGGSSSNPPGDVDADGKLEDLDGNGQFNFVDVIELVFALEDIDNANLTQAQIDALDIDDSGAVNFVDVIELVFKL
jgi:hypothetical protein